MQSKMNTKNISRYILDNDEYDFEGKKITNIDEIRDNLRHELLPAVRLYHAFEYDLDLYNREENYSLNIEYNDNFKNILNAKENKLIIKQMNNILEESFNNIIDLNKNFDPEDIVMVHKKFLLNNLRLESVICSHEDYVLVCNLFRVLKEEYQYNLFDEVSIYECLECHPNEFYFIADSLGFYSVYKDLEIIEYIDYKNFKQVVIIYRVLNLSITNSDSMYKINRCI